MPILPNAAPETPGYEECQTYQVSDGYTPRPEERTNQSVHHIPASLWFDPQQGIWLYFNV
jgi:hypothetical protein